MNLARRPRNIPELHDPLPDYGPTDSIRQYRLRWLFLVLTVAAVGCALIGFRFRAVPERVPEAVMMQLVEEVVPGTPLDSVSRLFGFEPSAAWLNEDGSGYVCWRFRVSDVPYDDSRASYFAKLDGHRVKSTYLLYPLKSAGGGWVF